MTSRTDAAMTDVRAAGPAHAGPRDVTRWLGWVLFLALMLFGAGVMNAVQGLVAIFDDDFYIAAPEQLVLDLNYTVWGWALLIAGLALVAAGIGVALGYAWARVLAVVIAALNAMVNLGFAGAYPYWTVIAISFDVLAIYALVVHGAEGKALRTERG
jgi:hypothetical protein